MKKPIAIIALTIGVSVCSAQPPNDESIRTLFKVMKAEALTETIYASMASAMRQSMEAFTKDNSLSQQQRAAIEKAPQRLNQILTQELSWAKIEPIQIEVYRDSFEQSEIDGLIDFYKSPVGQAFVAKMPQVTQKSMVATQAYIQQVMPRLKSVMDEILTEANIPPAR